MSETKLKPGRYCQKMMNEGNIAIEGGELKVIPCKPGGWEAAREQ